MTTIPKNSSEVIYHAINTFNQGQEAAQNPNNTEADNPYLDNPLFWCGEAKSWSEGFQLQRQNNQ